MFSLSRKVSFSNLGFIAVKSLSQDLRLIVKLLSPIVICLPNCDSFALYLAVLQEGC